MDIELIKQALLSEIELLEESLQIIANRLQKGHELGTHTNVDTSKLNNLVGKYQVLMDIESAKNK
ncbi:hypothetical protein [Phormidium nigroviride]